MEQLRTVLFLGLLTALLIVVGNIVGGMGGMLMGLVFAAIMNFVSYFWSDKIVIFLYRAKPLEKNGDVGGRVHRSVEHVAQRMQIPKPELYYIAEQSPNAFATGRGPGHASVVFTQGILQLLNEQELEGVIAHELSHIKNRDVLVSSIAATIAGAIGMLAWMLQAAAFSGRNGEGRNPIGLLVVGISIPIIAMLIQLAVSRSREFLADETAAKTMGTGHHLASALLKLDKGIHHIPFAHANRGTAHMFIANPFGSGEGGLNIVNWFQSHPPIATRVQRLQGIHSK